jgi:hypothetical protein
VIPAAPSRFKDLCLDANDHQSLADWWCAAMGYQRRDERESEMGWKRPLEYPVPIIDPEGHGPVIWVIHVPEPKTVKNRMHLDVIGDSQALLDAGATLVRAKGEDIYWDVLADPEGNEFCCFAPTQS